MARDFPAEPVTIKPDPKPQDRTIGAMDIAVTLIVVGLLLGLAAVGFGCASPGGQFVDHSAKALRQEGPASAAASLYQQDASGSRSMVGGFGPSQVIADWNGVSAASTLSQNTATLRIPDDTNGDGTISDGEVAVLNVAGNSDFAVGKLVYSGPHGSTITVENLSSLNSSIGPSVAPMVTEIAKAYTAASADRRAEYDRYMETAQVAIKEGRLALSDALSAGLKILTGGASAVIPSP